MMKIEVLIAAKVSIRSIPTILKWKKMQIRWVLYCSFLIISNLLLAQNTTYPDSLEAALTTVQDEATELDLLNKLFEHFAKVDHDKAQDIAENIVEKGRAKNDQKWLAVGYTNRGDILRKKFDYTSSLNALNEALKIYRILKDDVGQAKVLNKIGNTYFSLEDNTKALAYYYDVIKISERIGDIQRAAYAHLNIGLLNTKFNENKIALEHLLKAQNLFQNADNGHAMGVVTSRIGTIYHSCLLYTSPSPRDS